MLALKVKLNDLRSNMDVRRIAEPTEKDMERLERYKKEYERLMNAFQEQINKEDWPNRAWDNTKNNSYMAKKKNENTTSIGFEEVIWRAADKLRGNLNALKTKKASVQ